jgi:hypothetical protein
MTSAETRRASSLPPPAAVANARALKKADTAAVRPEATAFPPREASSRINTAGNFHSAIFGISLKL